jgi:hypothetical protein
MDLDRGGERVMRPGAFGLVPVLLFDLFDPDVLVPLVHTWVEEAMSWLEQAGKLSIRTIQVKAQYDPERLHIKIRYLVREENILDSFETEIETFSPLSSDTQRRS